MCGLSNIQRFIAGDSPVPMNGSGFNLTMFLAQPLYLDTTAIEPKVEMIYYYWITEVAVDIQVYTISRTVLGGREGGFQHLPLEALLVSKCSVCMSSPSWDKWAWGMLGVVLYWVIMFWMKVIFYRPVSLVWKKLKSRCFTNFYVHISWDGQPICSSAHHNILSSTLYNR